MKYLLITILLIAPINDLNKIAKTNELKEKAKKAHMSGNYQEAINSYHYLIDSMGIEDDQIALNLANAYYQNADTSAAVNYYNQLTASDQKKVSSVAYQQLGVIKNKQKKHKEALADFKNALRQNPYNEEARYNYELLKKLLDEQKQDQQQQNQEQNEKDQKKDQQQKQDQQKQDQQQQQDQENKDQEQDQEQQKQDQEGKEGEESEEDQEKKDQDKKGDEKEEEKKNEGKPDEPTDEENQQKQDQMPMSPEKLKEMNISEEKARMILEAMKNQEIQYLQQKKRKATQRPPTDKPDW